MYAHRVTVNVTQSHEINIRLPNDFPDGEAEVIVLASKMESSLQVAETMNTEVSAQFSKRFPRAGRLGPVVFNDDPVAPIDAGDWGEDLR